MHQRSPLLHRLRPPHLNGYRPPSLRRPSLHRPSLRRPNLHRPSLCHPRLRRPRRLERPPRVLHDHGRRLRLRCLRHQWLRRLARPCWALHAHRCSVAPHVFRYYWQSARHRNRGCFPGLRLIGKSLTRRDQGYRPMPMARGGQVFRLLCVSGDRREIMIS
ncbi:hypothetical protein FA95DRAFT_260915 [Auriscalpium vulgare]|uniref:Uncharacterized protein n=1 Tax=Auriscalpium vulgare TaxID=40419 RepID=A0ACB8RLD9_9AGAM|nr:hypothetical protein FA95DRAFT_260915 [Auriscalpium vulgare]